MPLSSGCTASARAMAASTTSGIDTSPACSASTSPTASWSPRASSVKAWTRLSLTRRIYLLHAQLSLTAICDALGCQPGDLFVVEA